MKRKRKMWCKSILLFNLLTLSMIFFDKHSLKTDFLREITPNFSCFLIINLNMSLLFIIYFSLFHVEIFRHYIFLSNLVLKVLSGENLLLLICFIFSLQCCLQIYNCHHGIKRIKSQIMQRGNNTTIIAKSGNHTVTHADQIRPLK